MRSPYPKPNESEHYGSVGYHDIRPIRAQPSAREAEDAPFGPGESPRRVCCICREWLDGPECIRKCGGADARRDERKDRRAEEGS